MESTSVRHMELVRVREKMTMVKMKLKDGSRLEFGKLDESIRFKVNEMDNLDSFFINGGVECGLLSKGVSSETLLKDDSGERSRGIQFELLSCMLKI